MQLINAMIMAELSIQMIQHDQRLECWRQLHDQSRGIWSRANSKIKVVVKTGSPALEIKQFFQRLSVSLLRGNATLLLCRDHNSI